MNVLMLSLLYPEDQLEEVTLNAKDKLQNQINSYQRAFIEGIRSNLKPGEQLDILNSLPVGIFPFQYRQFILKKGTHDGGSIRQLGCINLPWLKQQCRFFGAMREIRRWMRQSQQNRTILLYTQYLPYIKAAARLKRCYPALKAAVIVTDLPNEYGLSTGRKGLMKKLEQRFGTQSMELCQQMDGFVLLTAPMAEALQIQHKPYEVIEGLIQAGTSMDAPIMQSASKTAILYTGTLEPALGIEDMLNAFSKMPDCELWICGQGSMQQQVEAAANRFPNINFFGFVPQKEALALQAKATALINPRTCEGAFTRYSFPSKTLEYLRSGKPVLCYKLPGIPDDYDPYLMYFKTTGTQGMIQAVEEIKRLSAEERAEIGRRGREYVLRAKNPSVQCQKLLSLLRRL